MTSTKKKIDRKSSKKTKEDKHFSKIGEKRLSKKEKRMSHKRAWK